MSRKSWKWEELFNWNWFDCSKTKCDQKSNIIYSGDDLSDFDETKLNVLRLLAKENEVNFGLKKVPSTFSL